MQKFTTRHEIIKKIGGDYLTTNIENDEFSYSKTATGQDLKTSVKTNQKIDVQHEKIDMRFVKNGVTILIETKKTKNSFKDSEEEQLFDYVALEKELTQNDIIAILFNLDKNGQQIKVWKNKIMLNKETTINDIDYYVELCKGKKINDKNKVLQTTNELNELLHKYDIKENQRSQFVGCLLVALNNGFVLSREWAGTSEILNNIKGILEEKLKNIEIEDTNYKEKVNLIKKSLEKQNIKELKKDYLIEILTKINNNLIPYINDHSSQGEDLLNLFFTTFNKYVGKKDKNQAFTPTHITDFMCDLVKLTTESKVLDPTCGSGSFLVQAMSKMVKNAKNDQNLISKIKRENLFGIEKEEEAFGLATTNMLIHKDGRSNVINADCFNSTNWIKKNQINTVLMNPPFNAKNLPSDCPITANGMDATKGFYFVKKIADVVNTGLLATILPLQCAIGSEKNVNLYKKLMLEKHSLLAVFSLPDEVFYPGAAVNTCIMLFELGKPHKQVNENTFFAYCKEDGFAKRKNMGRIEKKDWKITKEKWLDAYQNKKEIPGFSIIKKVTEDDEWLAEAYMETDYSSLTVQDFVVTLREFLSYKVKTGDINE